ncbi:hypothetical protein Ciccas_004778 [Cichlidogyrus casuarinus]|uniref:Uncharacterized protein n=1 Tax=Cichlidogyrus casuarinus TaxID=1844966 RepID=A0ABD2QAK6_9PLAT
MHNERLLLNEALNRFTGIVFQLQRVLNSSALIDSLNLTDNEEWLVWKLPLAPDELTHGISMHFSQRGSKPSVAYSLDGASNVKSRIDVRLVGNRQTPSTGLAGPDYNFLVIPRHYLMMGIILVCVSLVFFLVCITSIAFGRRTSAPVLRYHKNLPPPAHLESRHYQSLSHVNVSKMTYNDIFQRLLIASAVIWAQFWIRAIAM